MSSLPPYVDRLTMSRFFCYYPFSFTSHRFLKMKVVPKYSHSEVVKGRGAIFNANEPECQMTLYMAGQLQE